METIMIQEYLHRNGIISERAKRAGRSLTAMERNIIASGRALAAQKGVDRRTMNAWEMGGERDRETVLRPPFLKAVFSYWDAPFEDLPGQPHYVVRESNHPNFPIGGHVDAETITAAGFKMPPTPSFETWIKNGRKVVRK